MFLDGAGSLITNAGSTDTAAVTVTGDSVTKNNLNISTASTTGGGRIALRWKGAFGNAENVRIVNSDSTGTEISGRYFVASRLVVSAADKRGIYLNAGQATLNTPIISSTDTSLVFSSAADSCRVISGSMGHISLAAGATKEAVVGTHYGTLFDGASEVTGAGNP